MLSCLRFCNPAILVELRYQLLLMIVNVFISGALLYYPTTFYHTTDTLPTILPLTPQNAEKIGMNIKSVVVETGLFIENFHEFDVTNNTFIVTAIIWFKFDPAILSLETIGQFSFDKGDIITLSKPETKFIEKKLFAQYRAKIKFSCNLDYRNFPVDDHPVFLTLTNKTVSPKDFIFSAAESGFSLSPNIIISGWRQSTKTVVSGYTTAHLDRNEEKTVDYYPAVLFSVRFIRSGLRQVFVLILPLFFVLFLMLMSLSLDPDEFKKSGLRISLSIANITALIGYRFIIENMSPKVTYFILSDHIFNLFLIFAFSTFFFNLATYKQASAQLRGLIVIVIHVIFLSTWYYLLTKWIFK